MVERMHSGADPHAVEEDFDWVNAWAAASARERVPVPALAAVPADAPARVVAPSETAGDARAVAPASVRSVSTAEADAERVASTEPTPAHADDAAPLSTGHASDATALAEPAVAPAPIDPEEEAMPPATAEIESLPLVDGEPPSLGRRPWTSLFRLIAGGAGQPAERSTELGVVTQTVSADLPVQEAVDLAAMPQNDNEHISLVPDQLERDIAEIEIVRDQLLSLPEPVDLVPEGVPTRGRTADLAPILVGAALGFVLLVVFGVAAAFVSLR
jgi:tetrahydromethanopterin S-methyltransferase subunit B